MNRRWSQQHSLAGAYVLDAIDGRERMRFERHLGHCADCWAEIAGLRETAARLAGAAAADPPVGLIERAVALAANVRQLSRPTKAAAQRQIGPMRREHWPSGRGLALRVRPGFVSVLAAMLLVAATALGAVVWQAEDQVTAAQQRGYQMAQVLSAPDAEVLRVPVQAGGTATIVMSRRHRALVFAAVGLKPLRSDRCYQLWLMGPSGDRSAGMLPAAHDGATSPVIASDVRAGDRVGLTIEPSGGARRPTSAPILLIALA